MLNGAKVSGMYADRTRDDRNMGILNCSWNDERPGSWSIIVFHCENLGSCRGSLKTFGNAMPNEPDDLRSAHEHIDAFFSTLRHLRIDKDVAYQLASAQADGPYAIPLTPWAQFQWER